METRIEPSAVCKPPARRLYFWERRRVWIWLTVVLFCSAIGFVASLKTTRSLVQFHRVGKGMTEAEVIELMGRPNFRGDAPKVHSVYPGRRLLAWLIGGVTYYVDLRDGKVVNKSMHTDWLLLKQLFPNHFGRDLL